MQGVSRLHLVFRWVSFVAHEAVLCVCHVMQTSGRHKLACKGIE